MEAMKEEKRLSGRLTLALAALLCLLFGLSLLLFLPGAGAAEPTEIQAAASLPERTLVGGDEADRLPTELLPGEKLDLNSATAAQLQRLHRGEALRRHRQLAGGAWPLSKCGGTAAGPRHRRKAPGRDPRPGYRGIRQGHEEREEKQGSGKLRCGGTDKKDQEDIIFLIFFAFDC